MLTSPASASISFSPHFHGRIGFISIKLIALTAYFGNWALITHIIHAKFLSNLHLFLLEVISANNSNLPPFQAHLKLVGKLLPPNVMTCVPPFMQIVERRLDRFQKNILNRLYNHSFFSIIFNMSFDSQCACLKSCVWLFACLFIPPFCLTSNIFLFALCTTFGLPHLLTFKVTHCIYDQP